MHLVIPVTIATSMAADVMRKRCFASTEKARGERLICAGGSEREQWLPCSLLLTLFIQYIFVADYKSRHGFEYSVTEIVVTALPMFS